MGIITSTTITPSRDEFDQHLRDLNLSSRAKSEKDTWYKSLCSFIQYERNKRRAEEAVSALRRLQDPSRFEEAIINYLEEKGWNNVKTKKEALEKLTRIHNDKSLTRKATVAPAQKTAPLDAKIKEQIQSQSWPLIKIRKCTGDKGSGAFASRDIPKDTVICDYHGEIVSKEDGDYRYSTLYQDRTDNVFMFKFGYQGKEYYCDAVKPCSCHPNKKIKGRFLNHSRKNPNVKVTTRGDEENVVLLMVTTKDISLGSELLFDYGCKNDSRSNQQDWI
jgi:hypothetical protein